MAAEGGLPESGHLFPALHLPAVPGAPAVDSLAATYGLIVMGALVGGAILVRIAMEIAPVGIQNLFEWLFETVEDLARGILGAATDRFLPFFATLFCFILGCNLIGLIPGCMSPTASYHTNLAMALAVAVMTQVAGISAHGFIGYLKHFLPPPAPILIRVLLLSWLWPFLHILEQFVRPISLTMRLFGNIFAKEILLLMLAFVAASFLGSPDTFVRSLAILPLVLRPAIILLGTLVSIVQAAVFTILSMVFVSLAMEGGHGEEGHHQPEHGGAT